MFKRERKKKIDTKQGKNGYQNDQKGKKKVNHLGPKLTQKESKLEK